MRLQITKSKNAECFYVVKSVNNDGRRSNRVVERLGNLEEVRAKANGQEPHEWAKAYVDKLNEEIAEGREGEVLLRLSPGKKMDAQQNVKRNVGQLYLKKLYYRLGWDAVIKGIAEKTDSEYDLDAIVQMLLYTRILFPASKKSSLEQSACFVRPPKIELHQVYRALDVLAEHMDEIQEGIYQRTAAFCKRNTEVLYYDCTNFFFEIEEEDEFRKYGKSKEHRPNPIIQMGLFIDGDGIPLAVTLFPGNESEQPSLKPLEKKILQDFRLGEFVVCTDAGLASEANRRFNCTQQRRYVVTQSLKSLAKPVQDWALEPEGWRKEGSGHDKWYNLRQLDEEAEKDSVFYKEQVVRIGGLDQRLIVTYSIKSRDYQRAVRQGQIDRAIRTVQSRPEDMNRRNPNDFRCLIQLSFFTDEGEISSHQKMQVDEETIRREERFDGYYGVCTNILPPSNRYPDGKSTQDILRINHMRWQIEDCFRDLKTHFRSRPVYLSRENRIKAHFLLCCLSLILLKYLEKAVAAAANEPFTAESLLANLRNMEMLQIRDFGYLPAFQMSPLQAALQDAFNIPLDAEITTDRTMKKILRSLSNL